MLQLLQHLGDGRTVLVDAPAPGPRRGNLVIRTHCSLISAGTERMLVDFGRAGWLGKARQQPEKVRAVVSKIRSEGLKSTVQAVRAKLGQPIPLGYCQVGTVADSGGRKTEDGGRSPEGEFQVGDRVVSNGPHAEVTSVAQGLCAKIPDGVSDEAAAFTPLAAIALEGLLLLDAPAGGRVVVTGLGLIGQLAVRILAAQGCQVLGIDPSTERRALAEKSGATVVLPGSDPVSAALGWTGGKGVDGVLITASSSSNEIVNQAARMCRHRGKVVLVGVVGLALNRADFYRNEVSFQVSCSYGSKDATAPNSAQGNFRRVLGWMAAGRLPVADLITHRFEFGEAIAAYAQLGDRSALGVMLKYGKGREPGPSLLARTVSLAGAESPGVAPGSPTATRVALIGAGNFAIRTLLPALRAVQPQPNLVAVVSHQGTQAVLAARASGARCASSDEGVVWNDPEIEAVFLTTRHDAHASQVLAALAARKHVWVEKPLCLDLGELAQIEAVLGDELSVVGKPGTKNQKPGTPSAPPALMVGFNRRFAPMAAALRDAVALRTGAIRMKVTVNAGRLDADHWTLHPRAGGGRILGEGCHFVDLFRWMAGTPITAARCTRRDADGQDGGTFELEFGARGTGVIDYRTDLAAHVPKELIEVTGDGFSGTIHNWTKLTSQGLGGLSFGRLWAGAPRKGHPEAIAAFLQAVRGGPGPIPRDELLEVARWSIHLQAMKAGDERTSP